MNWSDVSLAKFQQIEEINKRDDDDIDKVLYSVCVLFGVTEYELNNEKPKKALRMIEQVNKLFASKLNPEAKDKIGGYRMNYDIQTITFGQYIELAFFFSNRPERNMHKVLATMATPMSDDVTGDHPVKAEYFMGQPIENVIGALACIRTRFEEFNNEYSHLFGVDPQVYGNVQEDDFNKRHGWIYSATRVKDHEGITLEDAFNLPVRRALNALVYIKAKDKYDIEMARRNNNANNV